MFTMLRIAVVLLGLVVSACSSGMAPAAAQEPAPDAQRTLDVSAQATVTRPPDRARVRLAVETVARTARAATTGNAEAMSAVLDALEGLGIAPSTVQTESVSLAPRYDRGDADQEPTIVGYQAMNRVSVPVDDVDRVGAVVDAAVSAGANRVLGIQFELSDPESAYHDALEQAMAMARREAETAAAALDEPLGPAIRVSTGGVQAPAPQGPVPEMMRAQAASTPVQPGELEVRATVHITYRLGS